MAERIYKKGATKAQQHIIRQYFNGVSFAKLVKEYAASHTVKSETTGKDVAMPKLMAERAVYDALAFINWG